MTKLTKEQKRRNMQAVKSSGSKIEHIFASALRKLGYRYRKNDKTVYGKPDFVFKKFKIAVFIDSEFWHGKNWKVKKNEFRSNEAFWQKKIEGNIRRDKQVNRELKKQGWKILRFWGKNIMKNVDSCVKKVEDAVDEVKSRYR